jgi:Na+-transporting NADH:ubiquinone oxidoreductase subunit NqrB
MILRSIQVRPDTDDRLSEVAATALLPAVILTPLDALSVIALLVVVHLIAGGAMRGSIRATSIRGISAPLLFALLMPPELGQAWMLVGATLALVMLEAARDRWSWVRLDPLCVVAAALLWASGTGSGLEASMRSSGALLDRLATIPPGDLLFKNSAAGLMGLMSPVALLLAASWGVLRSCVDWRSVSACGMMFLLTTLSLPLPAGRLPMLLDEGTGPVAAIGAAITLLVATPTAVCILILINRPQARPMAPLPRRLWSACAGAAIALASLHVDLMWGAPLALAVMSVLAPIFDRFLNRPLAIDAGRSTT